MRRRQRDQPRYDPSRHDRRCPYCGEATRYADAKTSVPTWYVFERPTGRSMTVQAATWHRAAEAAYAFWHMQQLPDRAIKVLTPGEPHELSIAGDHSLYVHRKSSVPTRGGDGR